MQLAALERDEELEQLDPELGWPGILDDYYDRYDDINIDGAARSPQLCRIDTSRENDGLWLVEQTIDDDTRTVGELEDEAWQLVQDIAKRTGYPAPTS